MIISEEFDKSMSERRKRINRKAISTAEKLKNRVNHFLKNIDDNPSLTDKQKINIKSILQ